MRNSIWFLGAGFLAVGCVLSKLDVADGGDGSGGDGGAPSSETDSMGGSVIPSGGSKPSGGEASGGKGGAQGPAAGAAQGGEPPVIGEAGGENGGSSNGGSSNGGNTSNGGGGSGGISNGGSSSGGTNNGGTNRGGANTGGSGGASGGSGGSGGAPSILDVWPSSGCGKAYSGTMGSTPITLDTWGQKDANCADALNGVPKCGLWGQAGSTWLTTPLPRNYYVNLPTNYDKTKPYPLVLEGPGCGGNGLNIYPLPNLSSSVIRLGWTPPPNSIGHGTNPGQGCFDDREGDDSVEFVFWQKIYDKVESELCFDRNRVFIGGNSSGSWMANEMSCKYAGDKKYPVRAALANTGGLPTDPKFAPVCTTAPTAGMWVHETGDLENPFAGTKAAIDRALKVNKCSSTSYDTSTFVDYPIGGGNADTTCKKIVGCPADYPLVVCALPGNQHASHDSIVNPGFATFVTALMAP